MKVTVEFEEGPDGSRRVEESKNFLAFWRDPDGHIAFTSTDWTDAEIDEALAVARDHAPKAVIQ